MDLRNLPTGLPAFERISERRKRIESELNMDLSVLNIQDAAIGSSDEKNCEQMFGAVPIPVGLAGPLKITCSSKEERVIYVPLATTEGALVASVNRGCKALLEHGVHTSSIHVGINRSIVFETDAARSFMQFIHDHEREWTKIAEDTSTHLRVLSYDIDESGPYIFLSIYCDTDEAMGMNMVTIAAQAVGDWLSEKANARLVTVAGNVDSDKKPSARSRERGRGYIVTAQAEISDETMTSILKSDAHTIMNVANAKLIHGSKIAGALSANLHAANIIAALYLATGQDAAHVAEGSLAQTSVEKMDDGIRMIVKLPAVLVGIRGGGTALPAQKQCLDLLLTGQAEPVEARTMTSLPLKTLLAECIGAAVLAGELSLLAAQASHALASAHQTLGR